MRTLLAFALTVAIADLIFLLTHSYVLAGITGVIGGLSWAHAQR